LVCASKVYSGLGADIVYGIIALRMAREGVLSAMAFHEKAGRSQVDSFVFSLDKAFLLAESPLPPSFHPHSSMSDFRSVQVGRSRYSRCCHLIGDLRFVSKDEVGPGH
jgi:hypothetical protein